MAQFWLNTEIYKGSRGLVEVRRGVPNKWQLDRYWAPEVAFTFNDLDGDPWWNEYVTKKRAFVDEVASEAEEEGPTKKNWRKSWHIQLYESTTMTYRDIAKVSGASLGTVASDLNGIVKYKA